MFYYLIVLLLAFLPISEVRGAIPAGIYLYHLQTIPVIVISFIGNILAALFALFFLRRIIEFTKRLHPLLAQAGQWFIKHSYKKFDKRFQALGSIALISLVAIPLPFTGAWSAALAASLFRIPIWYAFGLISVGVLIATIIVSFISLMAV